MIVTNQLFKVPPTFHSHPLILYLSRLLHCQACHLDWILDSSREPEDSAEWNPSVFIKAGS